MNKQFFKNRMVKTVSCIIFCIMMSSSIKAQSGSIKGKVIGIQESDVPIVNLLFAKDSTIVKVAVCESNGSYEFQFLKDGSYLVNVTQLGYHSYLSAPLELTSTKHELILPDISLTRSSTELKEVEITAKKPFVQHKIDRTIVNPDALISTAGSNALEVLQKSPGVLVDMNGTISLKGKQGVVVFIDDKPTYMSNTDLASYLRSLPAGSIETIELMTNPPAKYEAAGNAGIINIKLKRDQTKGFNGGITLGYGQGRYMRSNNSFNFNYSVKKINLFSNIGWNVDNFYQDLTIHRYYYTPDGALSSTFFQNSYIKFKRTAPTARVGMDYYVSKKSTFGIVLSGFYNSSTNTVSSNAIAADANGPPTSLVHADSPTKGKWKNGSANLNYSYKLDDKGKELSANADYIAYHNNQAGQLTNSVYTPDQLLFSRSILESSLPADIIIQSAKVDYTHPTAKLGKLDAGVKASLVHTDNTADYNDVVNDVATPDYQFSNRFQYKENIYAGYLNYSKDWQKFSMQLGLRVENTRIDGHQLGNPIVKDSSFHTNYTSGFPTCYFSYKVDSAQKNQFTFSFGRRIDRPNYQDLNPFTYPLDGYTYYAGNPFLKPTFSYNLELSHIYKSILTTALDYSIAKNVINETIEQRGAIFYSRPGNYGQQITYGISVNANITLKKWWTLQLYTEFKNLVFKSTVYGQELDAQRWYWYIGPNNQFTINKKLSLELGGSYITKILVGQLLVIPQGQVWTGLAYKILKEKGTIKLNVQDLFYTNKSGGDIRNITNATSNWRSHMDSRVVYISFAYSFNKGKTRQQRQSGASDSEKERVKTN